MLARKPSMLACTGGGRRERDECQLERKRDLRTSARAWSDTMSPRELWATRHLSSTTTPCPVTRTPATLLKPEAPQTGEGRQERHASERVRGDTGGSQARETVIV